MSKRIIIKMTEKQMFVARDALEFYSRFLSGQLDYLPDELRCRKRADPEAVSLALRNLKQALFPELHPNESYSIGRCDDTLSEARQIAYEEYRQIYVYQTAERKDAGEDVSMNVYAYPTMRYSKEPLIEIKPEEIEDGL